jgi:hypothetical protein
MAKPNDDQTKHRPQASAIEKKKPNITSKVKHTWTPILDHPNSLPADWHKNLEVLVGITLSRPPDVTGETR